MKMSMEHWWNDSERGKQMYAQKNLSHALHPLLISNGLTQDWTRDSVVRSMQTTAFKDGK